MTTTHPDPSTLAALREQSPGTVLIFRVGDSRYAAYGDDAVTAYFMIGRSPGFVATIGSDGPYVTFTDVAMEVLLANVASAGLRAAVVEQVPKCDVKGQTIERVVTEGARP